jgi:hypothetical protein
MVQGMVLRGARMVGGMVVRTIAGIVAEQVRNTWGGMWRFMGR